MMDETLSLSGVFYRYINFSSLFLRALTITDCLAISNILNLNHSLELMPDRFLILC